MDADRETVERRQQQLREAAQKAEMTPRTETEAIAHLIPKRNIETWILCLGLVEVDEDTDYHDDDRVDRLIRTVAETFYHWSRPGVSPLPGCVPSLLTGIEEAIRIEG